MLYTYRYLKKESALRRLKQKAEIDFLKNQGKEQKF